MKQPSFDSSSRVGQIWTEYEQLLANGDDPEEGRDKIRRSYPSDQNPELYPEIEELWAWEDSRDDVLVLYGQYLVEGIPDAQGIHWRLAQHELRDQMRRNYADFDKDLQAHFEDEDYGTGNGATHDPPPLNAEIGGDYTLIERVPLHEGMGIIFKARQRHPARFVAIKMIDPERLKYLPESKKAEYIHRFRFEGEMAARLRHPHIVSILKIGEHAGLPFIVMDWIEGGTLKEALGGRPQPYRKAAKAIETLAEATGHAHRRGTIHRDLKPGNVLIQAKPPAQNKSDAPPAANAGTATVRENKFVEAHPYGHLMIVDFGLAKPLGEAAPRAEPQEAADSAGVAGSVSPRRADGTSTEAILGTILYMAPEQAAGRSRQADQRSDVYSLGVILYEMLTGRPPFRKVVPGTNELDVEATKKKILNSPPVPPSRIQGGVPRTLEAICLKCLAKNPMDRYDDADKLAEDIKNFRENLPTTAFPRNAAQRGILFYRRHPFSTTTVGMLLLGLSLAITWGGWAYFDAVYQEGIAKEQTSIAIEKTKLAEIKAAEVKIESEGRELARRDAVNAKIEAQISEGKALKLAEDERLARESLEINVYDTFFSAAGHAWTNQRSDDLQRFLEGCPKSRRQWEWFFLARQNRNQRMVIPAQSQAVQSIVFSRDGQQVFTAGFEGVVNVWNSTTGEKVRSLKVNSSGVLGLAMSPDGEWLASAGRDKKVIIWHANTGKLHQTLDGHHNIVSCVDFSPDGAYLASSSYDKTVKIWNTKTWKEQRSLSGHLDTVTGVAFRADGKTLTSVDLRHLKLWEISSGQELGSWNAGGMFRLANSSRGDAMAVAGINTIKLLDNDGKVRHTVDGNFGMVSGLRFSSDGQFLITGHHNHDVAMWETGKWQQVKLFSDHGNAVGCVAIDRDGKRLASGGSDGIMVLRALHPAKPFLEKQGHDSIITSVAVDPQLSRFASSSYDGTVKVWDWKLTLLTTLVHEPGQKIWKVVFHPNKPFLASVVSFDEIVIWDLTKGQRVTTLRGQAKYVRQVVWSPDGRYFAAAASGKVHLWDGRSFQKIHSFLGHRFPTQGVAFTPDNQFLASSGDDNKIMIWNLATKERFAELDAHTDTALTICFSPDGSLLASGSSDQTIRIWDWRSKKVNRVLRGHRGIVVALAFSANGQRLISSGSDGTVKIWDRYAEFPLLSLPAHKGIVYDVAFGPQERHLVSVGQDNQIRLWDGSP